MDDLAPVLRAFDWTHVQSQLERACASQGRRSPEEIARILEERARTLARPQREEASSGVFDLLAFGIGRERYAVDVLSVVDVIRFVQPTRLPCTPPVFLGIVNHKGLILPVLDLRRLFGSADADAMAWRHIVTIEAAGTFLGLAADSLAGGICTTEELAPAPGLAKGASSLIRGLTAGTVAVLDMEALARDPRIVVDEEVK
jgi:purine-binding chemotaxis protein CheW